MKVADFYFSGTGTDQNIDESVHWYQSCCTIKVIIKLSLGLMGQAYNNNPAADKVIRSLYKMKATHFLAHWVLDHGKQTGDSNAQYAVGWMYYTGKRLNQR